MSRVRLSALGAAALISVSCGTADYQRPIAQFQAASSVVTQASRGVYTEFNALARNSAINRAISRRAPIDIEDVRSRQFITPEEIDVRVQALDTFQSYVAALAELAGGKAAQNISSQTDSLSKALSSLSKTAATLPKSKANFIRNGDLGTSLTSVANVLGAVASLIAQHKAKAEIIKSVIATRKPIDDFTNLLQTELDECLSVQKTVVADEELFFTKAYQDELRKTPPDTANLLVFGEHIKDSLQQNSAMASVDPKPAFQAMRNAHAALVQFVQEPHNPKSLTELLASAQTFFNEVKPFGDAVQALTNLR